MTTTTANAANVLAHLEKMLDTQWPDLRVAVSSSTEQWASMAVAGPNSRKVLAKVMDDIDIDARFAATPSYPRGDLTTEDDPVSYGEDLVPPIKITFHESYLADFTILARRLADDRIRIGGYRV